MQENERLVDNIDVISEELDYLTICNKNFNSILDNDSKTILGLLDTIKQLEKENNELKAIDNLDIRDIFEENDSRVKINTEFNIYHNRNNNENRENKRNNNVFAYNLNSLSCFSNNN